MINIKKFSQFESMIQTNSLNQLKRVSDIMGKSNIGVRVSDGSFSNALNNTKRDITQTKIQTYDQYMSEPFSVNQNRSPWEQRKKKKKVI